MRADVTDDVPAIADLHERENHRFTTPTLTSTIVQFPSTVAYRGHELVGFALTKRFGPDVLELCDILVAADARGAEIGTRMLKELDRIAVPQWKGLVLVHSMGYAG